MISKQAITDACRLILEWQESWGILPTATKELLAALRTVEANKSYAMSLAAIERELVALIEAGQATEL